MNIEITRKKNNLYRLHDKTIVNASVDDTFNFFSSADNLNLITPPWLRFNIETPRPILMKKNTIIDYKLKLHMISVRWRSLIELWDPPNSFVDKQLIGPYNHWRHLHKIIRLSNEETVVEDIVDYRIPFGFLGRAINYFYVKKDLVKIFSYRKNQIISYFNN